MIQLCTFSKSGEVVEGEMIGVEPDGEEASGQVQHIIIQVCSLALSFDFNAFYILISLHEKDSDGYALAKTANYRLRCFSP